MTALLNSVATSMLAPLVPWTTLATPAPLGSDKRAKEVEQEVFINNCIERESIEELVKALARGRVTAAALQFAVGKSKAVLVGNVFASPALNTTPLHAMCRNGDWLLVRYAIVVLPPTVFWRTVEPHTNMTPLHVLAQRNRELPTVNSAVTSAANTKTDEENWFESVFLCFEFNALARGDSSGNNVLHYLALHERGQAYDRVNERFKTLSSARNRFGQRPADMRVAQQAHDIIAVRCENTGLRAEIESVRRANEGSAATVQHDRAKRMTKHVDTGTQQLAARQTRSKQLEEERFKWQQKKTSLETEARGMRLRCAKLEKESSESRALAEQLQKQCAEARELLEQREEEQDLLDKQLSAARAKAERHDIDLRELHKQREQLQTALDLRMRTESERVDKQMSEARQSIADLERREREALARAREESSSRISQIVDASERERASVAALLEQERAATESARRAAEALGAHQRRVNEEALRLTAERQTEVEALRAATESQIAHITDERRKDSDQIRALDAQLAQHVAEVEQLRANAADAQNETRRLNAELETASSTQSQTKQQLDAVRCEQEQLRAHQQRLLLEAAENEAEITKQREQLRAQLNDTRQMLDVARAEAETQAAEARTSIEAQQQRAEEKESALKREAERAAQMNEQLEQLRVQVEERERAFKETEDRIAEHQRIAQHWQQQSALSAAAAAAAQAEKLATEERLRTASRLLDTAKSENVKNQAMIEEQRKQLVLAVTNAAALTSTSSTTSAAASANGSESSTPRRMTGDSSSLLLLSPRRTGSGSNGSITLAPGALDALTDDSVSLNSPRPMNGSGLLKRSSTLRRGLSGARVSAVSIVADAERERQKRLVEANALAHNSTNDRRFFTHIEHLVVSGDVEKLRQVLDTFLFSVNHLNERGESYLSLAIKAVADAHLMYSRMRNDNEQALDLGALVKRLTDMVEFLMRRDCQCSDIEAKSDTLSLPEAVRDKINNRDDLSPFCQALIDGDPEKASTYIGSVTDVNRVPLMYRKEGFTYLHLAVQAARSERRSPTVSMVELLVRRGADATRTDANGRTPLHTTFYKKMSLEHRRLIVRYLMAAGTNPEAVCEYQPLLKQTSDLARKQPSRANTSSSIASLSNGGSGVSKRSKSGGGGGLSSLTRRVLGKSTKKTQTELRAEKSSEAQRFGTPLAMAHALGDHELIEMLTNARYRRLTLPALTAMVVGCVEFQTTLATLRETGGIVDNGLLDAVCERYRYTFYRFSPHLTDAVGNYHVVFTNNLRDAACVNERDSIAEMQEKVHRLVEQDLFLVTLLESRGAVMLRQLDRIERCVGQQPTDDDCEFDVSFEEDLGSLVALSNDTQATRELTEWLQSEDCAEERRPTRVKHVPLVRKLVQALLVAEALAPHEVDVRVARETAKLNPTQLTEYMNAMQPIERAGYDQRRMKRNANHTTKLLQQLMKFQEAILDRKLDVDDMIAAPALAMYPNAVMGAVRQFIEKNQTAELANMIQRGDALYGDLELETVVDEANTFSGVEYAASIGAVRALEWFLSVRPQRIEEVGSCNKSLVIIAASRDQPLIVVAIDHFLRTNPYWNESRLSVGDHPNLEHYGLVAKPSEMNVLQLCRQQARPDLLRFCIKTQPAKVAKLVPDVDFKPSITTFSTDQERAAYTECIEILRREYEFVNGISKRSSATSPRSESSNGASSPFISLTAASSKAAAAAASASTRTVPTLAATLTMPPSVMHSMKRSELRPAQSSLALKASTRLSGGTWETLDTNTLIIEHDHLDLQQPPPPLEPPPPPPPPLSSSSTSSGTSVSLESPKSDVSTHSFDMVIEDIEEPDAVVAQEVDARTITNTVPTDGEQKKKKSHRRKKKKPIAVGAASLADGADEESESQA